jgi:hypothetical protein
LYGGKAKYSCYAVSQVSLVNSTAVELNILAVDAVQQGSRLESLKMKL